MGTARICRHCRYAARLQDGRRTLLVCANRPEAPGQLQIVGSEQSCRNFRWDRQFGRCEPPAPPSDEIRYIALTKGKFAIVDAADYQWLSKHRWYASTHRDGTVCYAARNTNGTMLYMHRVITAAPEGTVVDHADGNGLNNRRSNLRMCTQSQNTWNQPSHRGTSRYKGVYYERRYKKWHARIVTGGKKVHIGYFRDEIEAARAYDRKAAELFGEFAYLNFPDEIEKAKR